MKDRGRLGRGDGRLGRVRRRRRSNARQEQRPTLDYKQKTKTIPISGLTRKRKRVRGCYSLCLLWCALTTTSRRSRSAGFTARLAARSRLATRRSSNVDWSSPFLSIALVVFGESVRRRGERMGGGKRWPDRGLSASSGERGSSSRLSGCMWTSAAGETQMEGTDSGESGEETRRVGAAKRVWVYIV
ncbi:hypothetical protein BDV93DRAFT_226587 [Ceratobasidium sp. AG-I]|nr:hypothetical protein BDV93DRAFT_226587 [Ceratobasidium sp. AG-I]